MKILTIVCLTLFAGSLSLSAAETAPTFAAKPGATRNGEKVTIVFAVSEATDVEVGILDAQGKVVCHLAAGVLGAEQPPPEPLKAGLAQSFEWDMRDDFGKPAAGGPFKVRVRARLGVKFGRILADSPYMISDVKGLATDDEGNLYVNNQNWGYGSIYTQIYDAEGKYLRTIMPIPANLPRERVSAFAHWDEAKGRPMPHNSLDVYANMLPTGMAGMGLLPRATKDAGLFYYNGGALYHTDIDGGVGTGSFMVARTMQPLAGVKGQEFWSGQQYAANLDVMATVSPDGKRIYVPGLMSGKGKDGKLIRPDWPPGRIFSMAAGADGKMEPFATLEMPDDWDVKCNGPSFRGAPIHGLAVDAKGNVYAADRVHHEVVVLDPAGKRLGAIGVKFPHRIAVHPASGAVYVLTLESVGYCQRKFRLVKFSGWKDAREVATLDLGVMNANDPMMALSVRGEKTAIWIAGIRGSGFRVGRGDVTCYEDRGAEFATTVKLHEKDPAALGNQGRIAVDPANEDVYVNDGYSQMYRYNGLTGEGGNLQSVRKDFFATDLAVGPDGYLYVRSGQGYSGPFERLDRELKPVPFASGTNVLSKYIYSRFGAGYGEKGIGVGRDGKTYINFMYNWIRYATYGFDSGGQPLKGAYLEGKMSSDNYKSGLNPGLNGAIVGPIPKVNGGVRVDSRGNIYIGMLVGPEGYAPPAPLAKDKAWSAMVGSVVKFGPEGGEWAHIGAKEVIPDVKNKVPEGAKGLKLADGNFMVGGLGVYPGLAPFSGSLNSGTGRPAIGKSYCDCVSARFDLDRYDRLYLPNAVENSVRIYDNAGNVILNFGGYGNYDSQYVAPDAKDKKPLVPVPYIPLGWPVGTGVSDEHIYVCDQLNRCVVRADITHAAEETAEIK